LTCLAEVFFPRFVPSSVLQAGKECKCVLKWISPAQFDFCILRILPSILQYRPKLSWTDSGHCANGSCHLGTDHRLQLEASGARDRDGKLGIESFAWIPLSLQEISGICERQMYALGIRNGRLRPIMSLYVFKQLGRILMNFAVKFCHILSMLPSAIHGPCFCHEADAQSPRGLRTWGHVV